MKAHAPSSIVSPRPWLDLLNNSRRIEGKFRAWFGIVRGALSKATIVSRCCMKDQEKIDRARGRGAGPRTISLFRRTKDVKTSLTTSLLRINRQPINGRRIDDEGEEVHTAEVGDAA